MDTRSKIVQRIEDAAEAVRASGRPLLALSGFFDVLTPSLVERTSAVTRQYPRHSVLALVLELDGAMLSQRARAELAASLRAVDHVAMVSGVAAALELTAPEVVVRDEENQLADRRLLIQHVHTRYRS